jgi:hypothetical protein
MVELRKCQPSRSIEVPSCSPQLFPGYFSLEQNMALIYEKYFPCLDSEARGLCSIPAVV